MLTVTITLTGESTSDLEEAARVVGRQLAAGFTSGHSSNATGSYTFETTGRVDWCYDQDADGLWCGSDGPFVAVDGHSYCAKHKPSEVADAQR